MEDRSAISHLAQQPDPERPSPVSFERSEGRSAVVEPLAPEVVRDLIEDLVVVSREIAESDVRIEAEHGDLTRQVEREFEVARDELEMSRNHGALLDETATAEAVNRIAADFDSALAHANAEHESAGERVEANFVEGAERARRQHQDTRWEAETVFDATKHAPARRLAVVRKQVASIRATLDHLESEAIALVALWRQKVEQSPREEPIVEASSLGELVTIRDAAHREYLQLTALRLPRLFQGQRPGWLVVAAIAIFAGPAWWLFGLHALWVAPLAAGMLVAPLGLWLHRKAHDEVSSIYARLDAMIESARVYARQLVEKAERRRVREDDKIARRLRRDIEAAESAHELAMQAIVERRQAQRDEVAVHYPALLKKIAIDRQLAIEAVAAEDERRSTERKLSYKAEWAAIEHDRAGRLAAVELARDQQAAALRQRWSDEMDRVKELLRRMGSRENETFPDWSLLAERAQAAHRSPSSVRFGYFDIVPAEIPGGLAGGGGLASLAPERIVLPALLPITNPSLLIETRGAGRAHAIATQQAVMLRMLTLMPPGKLRFTIIDPVGLGDNFAAFMHLADFDEALVTRRIWTERSQIEKQLAEISEHIENVIQKYLRNEFDSIDAYNISAGEIAEPLRVLVIANFPANFTDEAARRLLNVIRRGARCGVTTLISVDLDAKLPSGIELADLEEHSTVILQKRRKAVWKDELLREFSLTLERPPDGDTFTAILHQAGRLARDASRVEVPFDFIVPEAARYWTSSSARGIDVPLGRSGAKRLQRLKLGHGTSQHVLIAGQTGSGKSTLLHALITNVALHYSPDEVELYLVDFKKGVEFKTYAQHRLPHARVVAIESDREFGLSVLERLDEELKRRAEQFRAVGVSGLAAFREASPEAKMSRILLIVDEFQELFVEDDRISQTSALLLDRLVRQGRAFGIHLLLGSQTLGGAYSLTRSTMGQVGVRIALRCSEVDAHLILSEDNSAARLLSRPGEAIYNDSNGVVDGNHPFQVVWIGEEDRESYLSAVEQLAGAGGDRPDWPQVVFEGNAPAQLDGNVALAELARGQRAATGPPRAWLGESVSIKDPAAATFRPQSGSNLLIVGQNEQAAVGVLAASAVSLAAHIRRAQGAASEGALPGARVFVLDGAPAGSAESAMLRELAAVDKETIALHGWREMGALVGSLAEEVTRRSALGNSQAPPVFLVIYGLQRFRDLRKQEDDFGFGRLGEARPPSPAAQLAEILREGPSLGVHTLVWCDSLNSVNRAFDRRSLTEFEMRIAFQMSGADSSLLLDTPIAAKLGPYRALYASEEEGCLEKFRPYSFPTGDWLAWMAQSLERAES